MNKHICVITYISFKRTRYTYCWASLKLCWNYFSKLGNWIQRALLYILEEKNNNSLFVINVLVKCVHLATNLYSNSRINYRIPRLTICFYCSKIWLQRHQIQRTNRGFRRYIQTERSICQRKFLPDDQDVEIRKRGVYCLSYLCLYFIPILSLTNWESCTLFNHLRELHFV